MNPDAVDPYDGLRHMINGFVVSQALYVVAKLRVVDLLDRSRERSVEDLADRASVSTEMLYRVLRFLTQADIVVEHPGRRFTVTEHGKRLRTDAPNSLAAAAVMFGELPYHAVGGMLHTVRTGDTAFDHLFGAGHEEYLEAHPDDARTFNEAIGQLTSIANTDIVAALDLRPQDHAVVDVGGGYGRLLAAVLDQHRDISAILVEQASVLPGARRTLADAGSLDRVDLVAADIFNEVPGGGDLYLLKSVVHAWDDDAAVTILQNCASALAPGGRVCVIDRMIVDDDIHAAANDLIMMTVTGGRERSMLEFVEIFDRSGLTVIEATATASGFWLVYGAPKDDPSAAHGRGE